jgi:hypothetical protein
MQITRSHNLGKAEARRRIEGLANYWRSNYGVGVLWQGDRAQLTGRVKGISFDAELLVEDKMVVANASDPGWLLRSRVKDYVARKLDEHLASWR